MAVLLIILHTTYTGRQWSVPLASRMLEPKTVQEECQSCYKKQKAKGDFRRHFPGELTTRVPEPLSNYSLITANSLSFLLLCLQTHFFLSITFPMAMTLDGNKVKLLQHRENLRIIQTALSLILRQAEERLLYLCMLVQPSSTSFH